MLSPAVYVKAYAKLSSWLWFNDDWNWTNTPIVMYLQNSGDRQTKANVVENAFWEKLTKANKGKSLRYLKTFNFDDYDNIPDIPAQKGSDGNWIKGSVDPRPSISGW